MKKVFIISLLVSGLAMLSFTNYKNKPIEQSNQAAIQVPANVQVALDKSCTMCHNDASKNLKGKTKLSFDKLLSADGYPSPKKMAKFLEIADEVKNNSMPPKGFLEKNPDKALTETEKSAIIAWAQSEAKKLGAK